MPKTPVWKRWPFLAALLALAAAGMACTFLTPTPVAWSLTPTPGLPAPAEPPTATPAATAVSPLISQPSVQPATSTAAPPAAPTASPAPDRAGPWLVYSRADGGQASAYDPAKGTSIPINLSGPVRFPQDLSAGASPQGGWLAVRSGQKDLSDLALDLVHLPEGSVRAHLTLFSESILKKLQDAGNGGLPNSAAAVTQPDTLRWSPDGRYLAFVGASDGPSADLYLFDTSTQKTRRLTEGLNQVARPIWSPDGLWVIFQEVTNFGGTPGWKLGAVWAAATDHNEVRKLYVPPANSIGEGILGWISPDTLLVYTQAPDAIHDVRAVPVSARFVDRLYEGPLDQAALDPAGKVLAFSETGLTGAGIGLAPGLYRLPGLKGTPQFVQAGDWTDLDYSPVLKRFTAAGSQGLLLFTPEGSSLLVKGEASCSASPDGHWLACWGNSLHPGLRLYQPDGVRLQDMTGEPVSQVLWQPNSQAFYYQAGDQLFRASFPLAKPVLLDQGVERASFGWLATPSS